MSGDSGSDKNCPFLSKSLSKPTLDDVRYQVPETQEAEPPEIHKKKAGPGTTSLPGPATLGGGEWGLATITIRRSSFSSGACARR